MNNRPGPTTETFEEQQLLDALHTKLETGAQVRGLLDLCYRIVDTPIGELLVASTDRGLVRVSFASEGHERTLEILAHKISSRILRSPRKLDAVARQLDEYFEQRRQRFELDLDLQLSTEFRRQVQRGLSDIEYGQTASYLQMAQRIGKPGAVRAVGSACATNPLPIVLPCHRVLRSDGGLGGYLGGLEVKRTLLQLENPQFTAAAPALF